MPDSPPDRQLRRSAINRTSIGLLIAASVCLVIGGVKSIRATAADGEAGPVPRVAAATAIDTATPLRAE